MSNDRISQTLKDFVPDELQGNSKFLDIITWNIRFFNDRDPERVEIIRSIFEELNADIFVLQEISEGSLDGIAEDLIASGAGLYKTVYGKSGGDIRVAFMYDTEWVKAKMEPEELFADDPKVRVGNETKSVFPRRPLHSTFVARSVPDGGPLHDPFDFHLVGLHLKSQRDSRRGHRSEEQRAAAARHLADWVKFRSTDEDVIIAGDWNASPFQPEWEVFRELETAGKIRFANWNPKGEGSHFFKSGESTRLDYIAVTNTVDGIQEIQNEAKVINWNVLLEGGKVTRSLRSDLIRKVSDHLPVLTRFYFTDLDSAAAPEPEETRPKKPETIFIPTPKTEVDANIRIVAAQVNPLGGNEAGREIVTLFNGGKNPADLSNWKICDRNNRNHTIQGVTIPSGNTARVTLEANTAQLSNKGGTITLVSDKGDEIHSVTYSRKQASQEGEIIVF